MNISKRVGITILAVLITKLFLDYMKNKNSDTQIRLQQISG